MLNMDVTHPDIMKFIDVKNEDNESVRFANISVNITDDFMQAVVKDEDFDLYFKVDATGEEIKKTIKARELFRQLAENNWNRAEPGVLFKDNIDNWHIMSADTTFEYAGVNPCGEEPLPPFGSCNLASINLSEFVRFPFTEYAEFDFDGFSLMVSEGVKYLNEVLDENMENHPLPQQTEVSRDLRQIGLGIMGLADMFIKMGIRYGSPQSIELSSQIAEFMLDKALRASAYLARDYGTFPRYNKDAIFKSEFFQSNVRSDTKGLIEKYGLRNSQLLTIAPTGSISTMIGVSGGIEPIFQNSYVRKSESLGEFGESVYYKVYTPIVKEYMDRNFIMDEEELPEHFVTSSDLDFRERINVQSSWQKYIDASISSTVNLHNKTTVDEIEELYKYAWEMNLKGITIYRDGCSRDGILITEKPKKKEEEVEECGT